MGDLAKNLAGHEAVIERGMTTFVEVGTALAAIRDGKLWMAGGTYANFEAYCKERWGWEKAYANRIAQHGKIAGRIADESTIIDKPMRASHVAPLTKLPESEQAAAWTEVVEEAKAEGKQPTAAMVQEVVARRMQPAETEEWEPVEDDSKPAKPPKNGREAVSTKERVKAQAACGVVTRFVVDEMMAGDSLIDPPARTLREALNALHRGINPR